MSVPEQMPIVEYTANGATTRFPITFDLHDVGYLNVFINKELAQIGSYTVENFEAVIFGTAPKDGDEITLIRDTQLDRETDYKTYDNSFRPGSVNYDFDKIWHVLQEQNLIDGKILARLKAEIEWRRTHDFNYDELAQVREKQLFDALKGYTDTLVAAVNPGIFQGVIAGVVFAQDGKSIQTHIDEILIELEKGSARIEGEKARAMAVEQLLYTKISSEINRAIATEESLQLQISTNINGIKYFETEAELLSFTPSEIDPKQAYAFDTKKNYLFNGSAWSDEGVSALDQAKKYTNEMVAVPENANGFAAYESEGKIELSPQPTMFYQKLKVKQGRTYLIKTKGLGILNPYHIVDAGLNVISKGDIYLDTAEYIVEIPENGAYLYVNGFNSQISEFKFEKISDVDINFKNFSGDYPKKPGVAYLPKSDDPTKVQQVYSLVTTSIVVENVNTGDVFKVDADKIGSVNTYYFIDNNDTIIDTNSITSGLNVVVTPSLATKLIACSNIAYTNFSVLKASYFDAFAYETLEDVDVKIKDLNGEYSVQLEDAYIPDSIDPTKIKKVYSPQTKSIVIDVVEDDLIKIDAKKIGIVKSYYFVDNTGTIISSEGPDEPDLKMVTVPILATKLISCSDITYENFSILKADYFGELAYEVSVGGTASDKQKIIAKYPQQPNYRHLLKEKCPKFYNKLRNKTDDLTVCITGTSLAQGNFYTTDRADAITRPPLLHTNDLSSHIFDSLIGYWHGQQYRRYDHVDLTYSASTWSTIYSLLDSSTEIWDDSGADRNGLTKTTTSANASVSTIIPVGAWQFNFIYRSDSQSGNCAVSIAQGAGKVEVFNGSGWVEANGFTFSMLESAVTATKGNTIYQKRLKMRCKNKASGGIDSLVTAKNITISKGNNANRFNVVGFEWSPREYMLTFINAARGSHAWGLTDSPVNLENYQDSDIWEFNPDLILCEVTAINWGTGFGQALKTDPNYYVNIAKKAYFEDLGEGWTNSLYQKSNKYTKCEIIFFGDTVATSVDYDMLWDANKQPKFGLVTTPAYNGAATTENVGRVKTIFENYEEIEIYMSTKPHIFIPVSHQFRKLADDAFGNYPDAFAPTGKAGKSLSIDRAHLNDNGAAFWAYLITPLFDNL